MYNLACTDGSGEVEYKQANEASKVVRLAKLDFERKIVKNIKKILFFEYARCKTTVKFSVDHRWVIILYSLVTTGRWGICLTDFLHQCLPLNVKIIFLGAKLFFITLNLSSYHINLSMVKAKLLKLKMNNAPGVELVGTRMLMELAEEISYSVAELFNKSLVSS